MHNFIYITPTELLKTHPNCESTLEQLQDLAMQEDEECANCNNLVWKYGGLDMCFTCITGEVDASEDYELIPDNAKRT